MTLFNNLLSSKSFSYAVDLL